MNYLWITLTTLAIISQVPHAYWAIEDFSIIKNQFIRKAQNAAFCVIISLMILGFVLEGLHLAALGGAIVDIVINIYYFQRGMSAMTAETKRKKWLRHFLAILMPLTVYFCSLMLT